MRNLEILYITAHNKLIIYNKCQYCGANETIEHILICRKCDIERRLMTKVQTVKVFTFWS